MRFTATECAENVCRSWLAYPNNSKTEPRSICQLRFRFSLRQLLPGISITARVFVLSGDN